MESFFLASLQMVAGMRKIHLAKLLDYFGTARALWQSEEKSLIASGLLSAENQEALCSFRREKPDLPERIARACQQKNIRICTVFDEGFPEMLKQIFDPPWAFYYRGDLSCLQNGLAMVGARRASLYGKSAAKNLAASLARAGFTIISGGARGIDAAAHQGALETGRTAAVLGCGVDVVYPRENQSLFQAIQQKGILLSEYPPGTTPRPYFFPARNRIISGLSHGVLVVEAAARSGSLITAEMALSEGRDVFAVPGSIYAPTSQGCHHLLQQGAKLVARAEDVWEEYPWANPQAHKKKTSRRDFSEEERRIYEILSMDHARSIDEIIYKLRGDTAQIAFLLLQMELKGWIAKNESQAYIRVVEEDLL